MEKGTQIRYFDAKAAKAAPARTKTAHSDFLRTGKIARYEEKWVPKEPRYLSHEEVAAITGRKLQAAGEITHSRLDSFHKSIRFPKMVFHRTIEASPHLGYCHVTASRTSFDARTPVLFSFYFANFFSELCGDENFFENIDQRQSRMYFAIAMDMAGDKTVQINKAIHRDGLLFRTSDPKVALKNVLMLGTRSNEMRKFIQSL
ncbi:MULTISPECIES: DUF6656 family protein [Rhizobium/Agrobacterium group]|uniref:DUF6656 family protein n=1 Tax=Rhizobium/Agrobacterium group TaxID=227290 RepID=UPI00071335AF|nr:MULTISPECIES: DUF6656 family protein [Rhizobium/Agrobacterium group]KQQ58405.1 hypothetical protein ASF69_13430 [Rhizobium sp. Leaf311]